ncbi:hypothetical protein [Tianweitania populi]|nr:hypothetical protein [Tianweitania populi]
MSDVQAQDCLGNCTYAHSFGEDAEKLEDLLDDFQIRLEFQKDDRSFPTVSDTRSGKLVWLILTEASTTPRLLALGSSQFFEAEVASWIDRANAELAEEELREAAE